MGEKDNHEYYGIFEGAQGKVKDREGEGRMRVDQAGANLGKIKRSGIKGLLHTSRLQITTILWLCLVPDHCSLCNLLMKSLIVLLCVISFCALPEH